MRLILASASPRRRDLLSRLDIPHRVVPSHLPEPEPKEGQFPGEYALAIATGKAKDVARKQGGSVILAGDTVVALDGEIFGKPASTEEAEAMLARLSGREHSVITALVVLCGAGTYQGVVESTVSMRHLVDEEIREYVQTGESMDKAGGYGVQGLGGSLVTKVAGCYHNVVGLPLCLAVDLLSKCGLELGADTGNLCPHSPPAP